MELQILKQKITHRTIQIPTRLFSQNAVIFVRKQLHVILFVSFYQSFYIHQGILCVNIIIGRPMNDQQFTL